MERNPPAGPLALLSTVVALLLGLHQLDEMAIDWADPVAWLDSAPAALVVGGVLRQIGLFTGYWVLLSAGCYLVVTLRRSNPRWVRRFTLPVVRRVVDQALAASIAMSVLTSPLVPTGATEPPPVIVFEASTDRIPVPHVVPAGDPPAEESPAEESIESPIPEPLPPLTPPFATVPSPVLPTSPMPETSHHTVVPGDNLWKIAAAQLAHASDATQVGAYWRLVIAANTRTLRSGDPNLIYPGELITLPPTTGLS